MDILGGYLLYIMSTLKITTDGRTIVIPILKKSVITLDGIKVVVNKNLKITRVNESNSVEKFLEFNGYAGLNSGLGPVTQTKAFSRTLMSEYIVYCEDNKIIQEKKTVFLSKIRALGFKPESTLRIGGEVSNGFIFYKKTI